MQDKKALEQTRLQLEQRLLQPDTRCSAEQLHTLLAGIFFEFGS